MKQKKKVLDGQHTIIFIKSSETKYFNSVKYAYGAVIEEQIYVSSQFCCIPAVLTQVCAESASHHVFLTGSTPASRHNMPRRQMALRLPPHILNSQSRDLLLYSRQPGLTLSKDKDAETALSFMFFVFCCPWVAGINSYSLASLPTPLGCVLWLWEWCCVEEIERGEQFKSKRYQRKPNWWSLVDSCQTYLCLILKPKYLNNTVKLSVWNTVKSCATFACRSLFQHRNLFTRLCYKPLKTDLPWSPKLLLINGVWFCWSH